MTAFYDAAAAMDEKGVSGDGRVAVLNPRQYYELIQAVGSNGLVNRDAQALLCKAETALSKLPESGFTNL